MFRAVRRHNPVRSTPRHPVRVLLYGYDPDVLDLVGRLTREGEARTVLADRPGEVLRRVAQERFDLVLLAETFFPRGHVGPLLRRLTPRLRGAVALRVGRDGSGPFVLARRS